MRCAVRDRGRDLIEQRLLLSAFRHEADAFTRRFTQAEKIHIAVVCTANQTGPMRVRWPIRRVRSLTPRSIEHHLVARGEIRDDAEESLCAGDWNGSEIV